MTQTEANLALLKAAELLEQSAPGAFVTVPGFGAQKLSVAIRKCRPRIERQAKRLTDSRSRRKTWVPPFIDRDPQLD